MLLNLTREEAKLLWVFVFRSHDERLEPVYGKLTRLCEVAPAPPLAGQLDIYGRQA